MRFDWTDLRVFLHACESGSMTEAASRASLTLAAVSARIRALEEEAGVLLLRRLPRGVAATAAGDALARHARVLFHQRELLRRDLGAGAAPGSAPTVLLANSSALARPLHRVLAGVLGEHPAAQLRVRESASEVTVHALLGGAADVGIVSDAAGTEGLLVAELGADPLVLLAPRGHALAERKSLPFSEVFSHDWISWGEGSALQTHLEMQAGRAGGVLKTRASVASAAAVVDLVARGFGVGVLPQAVLRTTAHAGDVAVLELEEPWARRKLLACRASGAGAPVTVALFDALRAHWTTLDGGKG